MVVGFVVAVAIAVEWVADGASLPHLRETIGGVILLGLEILVAPTWSRPSRRRRR